MKDSKTNQAICRSVFKSGKNTITKKQFTRKWIQLVNRLERGKFSQ